MDQTMTAGHEGAPPSSSRNIGRRFRLVAALGLAVLLVVGFAPVPAEAGGAGYSPFTSWAALVNRQFVDLTTKAPTSAQSSSWVSQLSSQTKAKGDLVDALR